MGDGVVDVGLGSDAVLLELTPIIDGLLSLFHDAHHGGQSLQGVLAAGGLAGEHHAAGAVKNGVGHVGHLSTGGTGVADHGIQHLSSSDDGLAGAQTLTDDLLLEHGHLGSGDLYAQVAAGHHDTVGDLQDLVDVVHALLVLDLGDDRHRPDE